MNNRSSNYWSRLAHAAIVVSMSAVFVSVFAQDDYGEDDADVNIGAPTQSEEAPATPAQPTQHTAEEPAPATDAGSVADNDQPVQTDGVADNRDVNKRASVGKAGGDIDTTPIFSKPHLVMGLGLTTVKGDSGPELWTFVSIGLEMSIWKFGIFLDFDLFLDEDFELTNKGWDFKNNTAEAVFRKIRYIRYGHEDEPLFVKFGGLENVTLGYGMIVDRFTNMLRYPGEKLPGLQLYVNDVSPAGVTVQAMISDFAEMGKDNGGVYALRLAVRPLKTFENFYLSGLSAGWMYAEDRNVYAPARELYTGEDSIFRDSTRSFGLHGFDVSVPIVRNDLLDVSLYTQSAFRTDDVSGWGIGVPGVAWRLWKLGGNIEYRILRGRFMPEYFNTYYLDERYSHELGSTKDASLKDVSLSGIFGRLWMNLYGLLGLRGSYQHMTGKIYDDTESVCNNDETRRFLEATVSVGDTIMNYIPLLDLAEVYIRNTNIGAYYKFNKEGIETANQKAGFFDRSPDMYWGYRAGINIGHDMMLIGDYRYGWMLQKDGELVKLVTNNQIQIITAKRF